MPDKSYSDKIKQLADQIHEVFIRTKKPDVYRQIKGARLYPDILSMTLFSILLFTVEWVGILALISVGIIHVSLNMNEIVLLLIVVPCALYIFFRGLGRVRPVYAQIRDYTTQLIKEGYNQSSEKERKVFFEELQGQGLIVGDGEKGWRVNDSDIDRRS